MGGSDMRGGVLGLWLALAPLVPGSSAARAQAIDPSDIRLGVVHRVEQAVLCLSIEAARELNALLAAAGRQREPTSPRALPDGCHSFAGEFIPVQREESLPAVTAWAQELTANGRETCTIAWPEGQQARVRCRAQRRPFFFMWARSTQGEQRALVLMGTPSLQDQYVARNGMPRR
jgi:hypothetical protein